MMANIGIDLDDVLANFMKPFSQIMYNLYGRPEPGTMPIDWEWSNFGLTQEQIGNTWNVARATENFWESLPVMDGVSPSKIIRLDAEHDLFFITARVSSVGGSIKDQSCYWLQDNLGIKNPTVLVSYDKGPLAAALKLDYFIDDRPKNVLEIKRAVPACKVYLKDTSHNQTFNDPTIPRVKDFNGFADIVNAANLVTV